MIRDESILEPDTPDDPASANTGSGQLDVDPLLQKADKGRWLVLAVPVLAVAVGGTKEPWVMGLLSVMTGLCYILFPPRHRVPKAISLPIFGVFVLCLSAFLPISSASLPEWRTTLTEQMGIHLSSLRSPQPWVTLESLLLMAVSAFWLSYCISRGHHTVDRRFYFKWISLGIAAVTIAAIYVKRTGIVIPYWTGPWNIQHYGPFLNRNHFASLLAVGGLLSYTATYDAYRNRRLIWLPLAACMLVMFAGLLANTSRAGILLFFLGLGTWMFVAGFRRNSVRRMAVFASVMLVLASGIILFGKPLLARFINDGALEKRAIADTRLYIFSDTVKLMADAPFLGIGQGNFEPVYALTKSYTDHMSRNLHPESDWLWFGSESGGIALVLSFVALFAVFRLMGPFRSKESAGRKERRIRNAAGVGVLLVVLHGVVDTPAHTLGMWTLTSLLVGLAIRPGRLQAAVGLRATWGHRGIGVVCIAIGSLWLMSAAGKPLLPSASLARDLHRQALQLSEDRDYPGAIRHVSRAILMKPLQWNYYFDRADWLLNSGRPAQEALADFAIARTLEPHSGLLCFRECTIWLKHYPLYAIPALHEAMQRDKNRAYGRWGFYSSALSQLQFYPELREPLLKMANEPKLVLVYLEHAAVGADFNEALALLLEQQPDLSSLSSSERKLLFRLWYQRGDKAALIKALTGNVSWKADGWPNLAEESAAKGDFREAYGLAITYLPQPLGSDTFRNADLSQLRRDFLFNPTDVARGLRLAGALRSKGMSDEAASTLDKVASLPDAPSSVFYEQAIIHARRDDFQKAWDALRAYMAKLPQEF